MFKGLPIKLSIRFLSLKVAFILANSADPDEMTPYACKPRRIVAFSAFFLGIHCLQKYLLTGVQNENS